MFRWCVLTKVIYTLCIFKFVMMWNEFCPPVQVWLLCDPMMGWCITRKQWLAPTSGSTVVHAAFCVLRFKCWFNYFSNIYQSMQYGAKYFLNSITQYNTDNYQLVLLSAHPIVQYRCWLTYNLWLLFTSYAVVKMRLLALARWRRVRRA